MAECCAVLSLMICKPKISLSFGRKQKNQKKCLLLQKQQTRVKNFSLEAFQNDSETDLYRTELTYRRYYSHIE